MIAKTFDIAPSIALFFVNEVVFGLRGSTLLYTITVFRRVARVLFDVEALSGRGFGGRLEAKPPEANGFYTFTE